MNLQQVKATADDIGDGGEDITTESLTKYEKACADLGVSLKEVKNGTVALRDPMEILKELSVAVSKESENSIKVSNLIASVGGKYRGNQLTALLQNFDTYEKMLNEFNSNEAVGSAFEEAMKSADNWSGSLNKLTNTWDKLISKIVHSDDAIKVINTASQIVDQFAESSTIDGLGSLATTLANIVKLVGDASDKFGLLTVAIAGIGTVSAFKGKGLGSLLVDGNGGTILQNIKANINNIKAYVSVLKEYQSVKSTFNQYGINLGVLDDNDIKTLQKYVDTLGEADASSEQLQDTMLNASQEAKSQAAKFVELNAALYAGEISEQEYTAATKNLAATQKVATVSSKALATALNMIGNLAISAVIGIVVKNLKSLSNAEDEVFQKRKDFVESLQKSNEKFDEESNFLRVVIDKYTELQTTTSNINSIKKDLVELQDQIIERYGDEADSIDILNDKYSEYIQNTREKEKIVAEQYIRDNDANYHNAQKILNERSTIHLLPNVKDALKISNKDLFEETYDNEIHKFLEKYPFLHAKYDVSDFSSRLGVDFTTTYYANHQEMVNALNDYIGLIKTYYDYNDDYYNYLVRQKNSLQSVIDESVIKSQKYESYKKFLDDIDEFSEKQKIFDAALDEYIAKQQRLNELRNSGELGNNSQIYNTQRELSNLKTELYELAGTNNTMIATVDKTVNSVKDSTSSAESGIDGLSLDMKELLEGTYSDSLNTIDKIKSAIQTMANGELLDWSDASELMFDIDTDHILADFEEIDGQYRIIGNDVSTLIQLKDAEIQKQIDSIEALKLERTEYLKTLKAKLKSYDGISRNSAGDYKYYQEQIKAVESEIEDVGYQIKDCDRLLVHFNSQLGDTIDYTEKWRKEQERISEEIDNLQKTADNFANAMLTQVDNIINGYEKQKETLESEKEALEDQLEILEEQKSTLEEIIDNYESVVDIVRTTTDKEIELLKGQQEAEESAIQAKIDALRDAHDKQEEENDLTEKQIELQEKLRDLEKARQTKVRTYSESRGYHYDVDKEAVANAQTAVNDAQETYDKSVAEKAYQDQIKALESEKDLITKNYEEQIKAFEDYYEQWKSILDAQTIAEKEQLAEQILGVEWREKIKQKDTDILNKFSANFKNYNSQLNTLVNNEIAALKSSIKAKEDEIAATNRQIQSWQSYKQQVNDVIDSIKNKYDEYTEMLGQVLSAENGNFANREEALRNFSSQYQSYIDQIHNLQSQLSDKTVEINIDTNLRQESQDMADFLKATRILSEHPWGVAEMLESLSRGEAIYPNNDTDGKMLEAANILKNIGYHADGGVNDYTGLAMLHGERQRAEVVFNASQAKELYNMVKTGDFAKFVAQRTISEIFKTLNSANSSTLRANSNISNGSDRIININEMIIKADNPQQFHDQFMREIGQYWKVQLTENKVK